MPEAPGRLLVVSDLHLSEGWDSDTKRLFKSEDFFFDHSFGRFLQAQDAKSRAEGHRLRLIIPGDFVDFLQVKTTPPESVQVMEGEFITSREQRFGLGTGPAMTCWKLRKLMDGHWRFFQALASFLVAGHDLVILPGNHDIEWIMPEVQGCFRAELVKYAPPGAGTGIGQQVRFLPWFYYEPDFLYIDHGHQYDALNSFDVFLHPYLPDGRIDLPAGSFFVRYLFNFLELDYPFADNMKPTARFLRWTLRHPRTWRAFPVYWSFFRETLAKAKPWDAQWRAHVEARQREVLAALAQQFAIPPASLEGIRALWAPSAIHAVRGLQLAMSFFRAAGPPGGLAAVARQIHRLLGVRYVLFGHTHEADLQVIDPGPPRAEYVNSGTWTTIFAESWEEHLLHEESEFVFVEFDRLTRKMELLRWRDDLGEGERVRLFQQA